MKSLVFLSMLFFSTICYAGSIAWDAPDNPNNLELSYSVYSGQTRAAMRKRVSTTKTRLTLSEAGVNPKDYVYVVAEAEQPDGVTLFSEPSNVIQVNGLGGELNLRFTIDIQIIAK